MLQIPTMILPSWFLVLLFLPISFLISFALGFFIKLLSKSQWNVLTFTSLVLTFISLAFYISEYRPNYRIIIPSAYTGEVRLLLTNGRTNDFKINKYGIGYINETTFKNGFRPTIIKNDHNISDQIAGYEVSSYATTSLNRISFDYLSFKIPGDQNVIEIISFEDLVKIKAIDTTRLLRK